MPRARTSKNPRNGNGTNTASVPVMVATGSSAATSNIEELIRQRAYELSEQRGFEPGREQEDWLMAEQQVLAKRAGHSA